MKTYTVKLPIAGHIIVEVEAKNAEEAIEAALSSDQLTTTNIESWEALKAFNQGNFCFCPEPWEAEVQPAYGEEPDEDEDEDEDESRREADMQSLVDTGPAHAIDDLPQSIVDTIKEMK